MLDLAPLVAATRAREDDPPRGDATAPRILICDSAATMLELQAAIDRVGLRDPGRFVVLDTSASCSVLVPLDHMAFSGFPQPLPEPQEPAPMSAAQLLALSGMFSAPPAVPLDPHHRRSRGLSTKCGHYGRDFEGRRAREKAAKKARKAQRSRR